MKPQDIFGDNPEGSSLINKLGDIISVLRTVVRDACQEILTKEGRVSNATDCLVQQYRVNAIISMRNAEMKYKKEDEDIKMIEFMKRKMDTALQEYEFFTLIANTLERERVIVVLEEKVRRIHSGEIPLLKKILYTLLGTLRYNRKGVLKKQVQYQLIEILSELEYIFQDDHFGGLSTEKHEIYYQKWKRYVERARSLDVRFTGPFSG